MGFLRQRLQPPVLLLPLAVLVHAQVGQTGNVPEFDELVVGGAGEEAGVPGPGELLHGFAGVLPDAAQDAVGKQVDGPETRTGR